MLHLTGDLGSTLCYHKRDYQYLEGLDWPDSRDGTIWMSHYHSNSRGAKLEKTQSRYSVGEVKDVGFRGRVFVMHKEWPENEYGAENDRKSPHTIRVKSNGEISCTCMAASCKQPQCRHADVILSILDQGGFQNDE